MTKKITILCLIFTLGMAHGAPIDVNTASTVARAFITGGKTGLSKSLNVSSMKLAYTEQSRKNSLSSSTPQVNYFYIFNIGTGGFVITSGDDNVTPILAYSNEGNFDLSKLPPNTRKWFENYKEEIRAVIANKVQPTPRISEDWQNLKKGIVKKSLSKEAVSTVEPLIQTQWSQSPYYNSLCPKNSVTGCVATAMAQIMKYWQYPVTGFGFHSYTHKTYGTLSANFAGTTYQWESMPNRVSSPNNAVATLMYQVGVSVDMNYSPDGSGAVILQSQTKSSGKSSAEYALKTYFGYNNTLHGVQTSSYTSQQWITLLKTELNGKRPILYGGFNTDGGHCFVLDGYDSDNFFHVNWGWSGNCDGYYTMGKLNPKDEETGKSKVGYNSNNCAVIGIEPPSTSDQTSTLKLYADIVVSPNQIYWAQPCTVTTNIANYGNTAFKGDFCAAIFDNANNFVDYVAIDSNYSLSPENYYVNGLKFIHEGSLTPFPSTYFISIFYRPTNGKWIQAADNDDYINRAPLSILNYPTDIKLNSEISVSSASADTLTQSQSGTVTLNLVNTGTTSFIGEYMVGLYKQDSVGTCVQLIDTFYEDDGLEPDYTYKPPYLKFATNSIIADPGTYLLMVWSKRTDVTDVWRPVDINGNYLNPIKVVVRASSIKPDPYEPNDSVSSTYNLPISFSGNLARIQTKGANCHTGIDNDYYKVELPSGFDYTLLSAKLYDGGNDDAYTLDALFSYSLDGKFWSEAYDDDMTDSTTLHGGSTVYFHVAPYLSGTTGTYALEINLKKITTSNVLSHPEYKPFISFVSSGKSPFLNIGFSLQCEERVSLHVYNLTGSIVAAPIDRKFSAGRYIQNLNIGRLAPGFYIAKLTMGTNTISSKILMKR